MSRVQPGHLWFAGVGAVVAILALAIGARVFGARSPSAVVKLQLVPPQDSTFGAIAVSPNGRMVAFTAQDTSGKSQLWVRPLDSIDPRLVQETEGAAYPFWSPDSQSIAFFAGSALKRVEVSGAPPRTISQLVNNRGGPLGGTWNRDGVILFTADAFGPESIYQVSASGGEPRALKTTRNQHRHWPVFLPDGRRFLYFGGTERGPSETGIYLGSLDSPESRFLFRADGFASFVPRAATGDSDVVLFVRSQTLMAQRVDARADPVGTAVPVTDRVGVDLRTQRSKFSVSDTGVMIYTSGTGIAQLQWFDRAGKALDKIGPRGLNIDMRLSPDNRMVAVQREDGSGGADLWLLDLTRGAIERLTTHAAYDAAPVWSPDGSRIFFFSLRDGPWSIYQRAPTGTGDESLVLKTGNDLVPLDVSPDGRFLLYHDKSVGGDILILPLKGAAPQGSRLPPLAGTQADEHFARFSPDGKWVVYVSDESGRYET